MVQKKPLGHIKFFKYLLVILFKLRKFKNPKEIGTGDRKLQKYMKQTTTSQTW